MRRKRHEEHVNHERWAIPYGDLITLLLAFFVVMYAMSAVNEGKYRVLSQSMMEAFHGSSRVIAPSNLAPEAPATVAPAVDPQASGHGSALTPIPLPGSAAQPAHSDEQKNLSAIQHSVEDALKPLIEKNLVALRRAPNWLEIEIRTDILFPSGVARIAPQAQGVLDNLGGILAPFPNPLRIEGYTDNKPISTPQFPSNWELSAARAASVARLFADRGVALDRLGIMGWGEVRPIADNSTEEGRNRNRRVLVVVLSDRDGPSRFTDDAKGQSAEATPAPTAVAAPGGAVASAQAAALPPATGPATVEPAITVHGDGTATTAVVAGHPPNRESPR
ncbi:flagellar motor protein MotD [Dyella lutea]|uniref:Flagellar motor protein MotD n=1 Tax=Dyella lutea TaxID=2950441 RepID=A0ABT1F9W9_9GAMM|nr:flagellar motor protein MotD [Dyella lutea]MCP1374168.1 flagellar motor protein MotD [Dyella lutea]